MVVEVEVEAEVEVPDPPVVGVGGELGVGLPVVPKMPVVVVVGGGTNGKTSAV